MDRRRQAGEASGWHRVAGSDRRRRNHVLNRKSETKALAKETEAMSVPTVAVVQPKAEPGNDELVLPGNLQAFEESPIFARTNGYLLKWYKDMEARFKRGTAGGD